MYIFLTFSICNYSNCFSNLIMRIERERDIQCNLFSNMRLDFQSLSFCIATHASRKDKECRGHGVRAYQKSLERIRFISFPIAVFRASGRGREIGSAESRIPSIGDRQGNSVGSRYRCGRGSVVGPFGNLGNDGIRTVGSTLAR
jgi:hypothetical protein